MNSRQTIVQRTATALGVLQLWDRLEKLHNENRHSLYLCANTAMAITVKGCIRVKGEGQWVSKRICLQNCDTKWHITSDTHCEHAPHIGSRGGLLWWQQWTHGYSACWFLTNTHRLSYTAWGIHYWQWTTCRPALPNKDGTPGPASSCPQTGHAALGGHTA